MFLPPCLLKPLTPSVPLSRLRERGRFIISGDTPGPGRGEAPCTPGGANKVTMRLIVGLGNPSLHYRHTRHNTGFRCVDLMARKWCIPLRDRRAKAVLGQGQRGGQDVVLAKPRTFMNHSGDGVAYLLTRFGAGPSDLVVIYDDMSLPLGKLRVRPTGSDGGHNGIRSIIATLGTQAFPRVRVGIGPLPLGQDPVAYVLGQFTGSESTLLSQTANLVVEAVDCLLEETIDAAMNRFN